MTPQACLQLAQRFASLHVAVLGDFCLDRYLEIDPALEETSLETGLPVHNVVHVRSQPGGAGTVVNNLSALGLGRITPLGFCGDDGEGFELRCALSQRPGVTLEHFITTDQRRTFTYGKPLVVRPDRVPVELNRLDIKNWTPTPTELEEAILARLDALLPQVDAIIVLDQVDHAGTGVITERVLQGLSRCASQRPELFILADSRRGLAGYPPLAYKMNLRELSAMQSLPAEPGLEAIRRAAHSLTRSTARPVFVTLAERGIIGAAPTGEVTHVPACPTRGPIDIVGAGDAVTANLTTALVAGASLSDTLTLAMAAASVVIHQLGTTGTATSAQIAELLTDRNAS